MTAHAWMPDGKRGDRVVCAGCGERSGLRPDGSARDPFPHDPRGPYPTCEQFRASKRHEFRGDQVVDGFTDYWCTCCGVVLRGYGSAEEFRDSLYGDSSDCDRVAYSRALMAVQDVMSS